MVTLCFPLAPRIASRFAYPLYLYGELSLELRIRYAVWASVQEMKIEYRVTEVMPYIVEEEKNRS
jgi:hypothetical protein